MYMQTQDSPVCLSESILHKFRSPRPFNVWLTQKVTWSTVSMATCCGFPYLQAKWHKTRLMTSIRKQTVYLCINTPISLSKKNCGWWLDFRLRPSAIVVGFYNRKYNLVLMTPNNNSVFFFDCLSHQKWIKQVHKPKQYINYLLICGSLQMQWI